MMRSVLPANRAPGARTWTPGALAALCAVLAVHVGLIVWVVAGLFPESRYNAVDETNLRQIVTLAAGLLVGVAFGARRHPVAGTALCVFAVALALLLPAAVLTTAWILFDAWLIGSVALRAAARDAAEADPALCVLAGLAIVIGLVAAAATLPVHYAGVYAAVLALPLGLLPIRLTALTTRLARVADDPAWTPAERLWLGVLASVVVLHVFIVAKPEVGYDAQTMHLQFARMLATHHAWTFDIERYAWAVMPLGADWTFALGYVLGGEACARALNLAFGVLGGWLLYKLVRSAAPRLPALVSVALFASAPLAFLVTGSLFSETLWCSFVLGTLVAALGWVRTRAPAELAAVLLCAAGALQCKAISFLWLAPLALGLAAYARRDARPVLSTRLALVAAVALSIGAWPYANAAWLTGNPVFPFFNAFFHSALLDGASSFTNPLYHARLLPWTPYELVMDSARFLEGAAGAPGFHWLVLLPLIVLVAARRRFGRTQWACLALMAVFFVTVYLQQAYLRYLLPALLVAAAAGGWALADLPDRRAVRVAVALAGCLLIALNLRFMYTGSWYHASLCRRCAFDAQARQAYIARYASLRIAADWLEEHLPDARVGFFALNDPSPAGYTGYSRGGNWHDLAAFPSLIRAQSADDVLALAREWKLTHVLVHVEPSPEEAAIAAFRDRDTRPMWQFENYRVAVVAPAAGPAAEPLSARR
jgi:hypothetical protein